MLSIQKMRVYSIDFKPAAPDDPVLSLRLGTDGDLRVLVGGKYHSCVLLKTVEPLIAAIQDLEAQGRKIRGNDDE